MLIKKPSLLLCSFQVVQCVCNPTPPSSASSHPRPGRTRPHPVHARAYADVAGAGGFCSGEHFPWPESSIAGRLPTPYEIFDLRKGSQYNKRRFFELVKIYHPDRNLPAQIRSDICPHSVRLERYRLIVAAHSILSDPAKRTAYDRYGAGWGSAREINAPPYERAYRWKPGQDPTANATWEDWERWYNRDQKSEQHPIFLSNGAFVGLVVLAAVLGGYGQATRAGQWGNTMVEQRDIVHAETSRELRRVRQAAMACGDREERIQSFLRHRDAATRSEEEYRRLLPFKDVCGSENVTQT
ncbi:putative domain containing protein [Neofusicoccum parvum UCRNP2]|uniref:Putative domain containing protein n=1 Tax=Botryosphaeria parva (strain UCR-NP2) TaxID=1287680 RepID=R1ERB9_BOTPV|nr:putative domain containing protein [Neofusicoccum parvum UCRNP2]